MRPNIGIYYGIMAAFGGFLASMLGGYITKKWAVSNAKAPAYVCAIGACMSLPFVATFLFVDRWVDVSDPHDDTAFWVAMGGVFFAYLTAEVWGGPSASIYQSILPSTMQGGGFAVYFFIVTIIGGAGTEIVATFPVTALDTAQPWVLMSVIGCSYLGASFLWVIAAQFVQSDVAKKQEFDDLRSHGPVTMTRTYIYSFVSFCKSSLS